MQQLAHAVLLSLALSVGAAPAHVHAPALDRPAHVALTATASKTNVPYGLVLSGEMLVGGLALMAGSAYALRRSRR